jgi:crotonobetainyl-CoA:carnitine CoA-transferase CaiB-like acyl-CoA transferase
MADIAAEPHVQARGTLMTLDDPEIGPVMMPAPVPRFSVTPARVPRPAPLLGEHNAEVYESLGLSPEEIEVLKAADII